MLLIEFVSWWYGRGFISFFNKITTFVRTLWNKLSIPALAKTLFSPWKRITSSYGKSVSEISRAVIDNTVSRLVGFTIRVSVILGGLIAMLILIILALLGLIFWPLTPLIILLLPIGVLL
jgi:hypothetical protein